MTAGHKSSLDVQLVRKGKIVGVGLAFYEFIIYDFLVGNAHTIRQFNHED